MTASRSPAASPSEARSSSACSGGISSTEWDTQGHGTHVAGTVGGENFANLLTHDTAERQYLRHRRDEAARRGQRREGHGHATGA